MKQRKTGARLMAVSVTAAMILAGCSGGSKTAETEAPQTESAAGEETTQEAETETAESTERAGNAFGQIDNAGWQYQEDDDVYWQIGISYCETPADETYETLGIFVPGAYMDAVDNGDGTYTCTLNETAQVEGFTALTAPIVIPVNTPGYSAMSAPTDYVSGAADYTDAGFIYVNAGCRGRDHGAPSGVTDLKAAVRYIRSNESRIPGSMDRIFTFGMSGGGAQSALMGATGDSDLYTPYLEAIGAVEGVSDAVAGSMCWCPITNLDYANEAYEWNLGISRTDLDEEMQALSDGMAEAFVTYINELGLTDEEGNILTLTESENGICQAGSYYDYIKSQIERSLNHFLEDTEFPYTSGGSQMGGMGGQMGGMRGEGGHDGGNRPEGDMPDRGDAQNMPERGERPEGDMPQAGGPEGNLPGDGNGPEAAGEAAGGNGPDNLQGGFVDENGQMQNDGIMRNDAGSGSQEAVTYETVQDYIDSLNADGEWIRYDSASNTATITSVEDFVKNCKNASKNVGAFDDLDKAQGENTLFGYADGEGAHFDAIMAELLADNETYGAAYAEDLTRTDALGNTVDYRINMYNPMYYLCDYYDGFGTAQPAKYWRIRTGINQGDTALCTEMNLALALQSYEGCEVDFETIWGEGHTMAERTGSSTDNFIEWVKDCLSEE
ncbi:MAG: tannase [Clostridiales bacterium]|nr:tannase [Clostridiales bacterium]